MYDGALCPQRNIEHYRRLIAESELDPSRDEDRNAIDAACRGIGQGQQAAQLVCLPPHGIIGYALIVDGEVKTEFMMQDHALKAARELKGRVPMLQVKIYDAENKRVGEIELAIA
jgi:hypothetical protein